MPLQLETLRDANLWAHKVIKKDLVIHNGEKLGVAKVFELGKMSHSLVGEALRIGMRKRGFQG